MPPTDPAVPSVPSPSDTQKLAAIVVQKPEDPHHIPQWAVKGLLAFFGLVVAPATVAIISWILGGIHAQLDKNEKAIHALEKADVKIETRLERNEDGDRRQWELIGDHKEKIANHRHN